ncbi:undecaprenyl/decaprenyl-phosphate alpha-N-acetylglucosaminyl 1-phosphate transferase [Porticoccaceae bacterium]|nr:undecaprenyl/decaprenyl-phosphate alpha-N-acetylglucosaminyl 1-phosphate transferase [Porticoccaceae bacterium]
MLSAKACVQSLISNVLAKFGSTSQKLFLMFVLAGISYGATGIGAMLLMTLLANSQLGKDASSKHGISAHESSRLGGLAIAIVILIYTLGFSLISPYTPGPIRDETFLYLWCAILFCTALGFAEDVKPDFLTPSLRLAVKFLVMAALFGLAPKFIPSSVGISIIDSIITLPFLGWALVTVFAVGFINALNMADGANGLVPGIAVASFGVFFVEYGRPMDGALLFAFTIFLIFNVISGWYFLGDAGSYGLGTILLGYGLLGVAEGQFSAGFMAALFCYPCIDFLVSVIRRRRAGRSPFSADNGHLHNRLHQFIKLRIKSAVMANSFTGLIISGSTSGAVLIAYLMDVLPTESDLWYLFFVAEICLYLIALNYFTSIQPKTQYADPL